MSSHNPMTCKYSHQDGIAIKSEQFAAYLLSIVGQGSLTVEQYYLLIQVRLASQKNFYLIDNLAEVSGIAMQQIGKGKAMQLLTTSSFQTLKNCLTIFHFFIYFFIIYFFIYLFIFFYFFFIFFLFFFLFFFYFFFIFFFYFYFLFFFIFTISRKASN